MMNIDTAEKTINNIYNDIKENLQNIISEEDSKIQIINRIFCECLGWKYSDFNAETHHENGYSDYILNINETPVLLVETKRIGAISVATSEKKKVRHLKISGASLNSAIEGVDQAFSYASPNGLPIAILTDGLTWIVFKTFIPGSNYKSKQAIVFPSLEAIIKDFAKFYDLLSKEQFSKKIYNSLFDEIHNNRLVLSQELEAPLSENSIKLIQKSEIAYDLEKVFSNFFSRLAGHRDEDLLIECFVETKESRIADFALEKITTNVLSNVLDKNVDEELANLIKLNIEIEPSGFETGQTVFIIGPTGAGKTTFLDRFFQKTLPSTLRKKCSLVKVNCLDATGRTDTLLNWLTENIIVQLEEQLFEDSAPGWDELLGLYHGEYKRRSKGVDSQLYNRDKQAFKEKFARFLEKKVETNREDYLKRILLDVVYNRKNLPIILVDNTDEFQIQYKVQIFQFVQALRRHAKHCIVIFPVTDKSAWSFSKTDIYGIYKSKSFFLPTPSPKEVFKKRIDFLKQKISENKGKEKISGKYFSDRGIRISIDNLQGFAEVLENVFVDQDYTSKTVGQLANFNIRRTLALSQRVITSSVIKIDDLIRSYLSGEPITTDFGKFINGLLRGNYEAFKRGDTHEIYDIFSVDRDIKQSPLLKLRILTLLDTLRHGSKSIEERHLTVSSIVEYFDVLACPEVAVDKALSSLLDAGLIEPYDISIRELTPKQKFAISYRGMVHFRLATNNKVFFYQMALTTPIINKEVSLKIKSLYRSKSASQEKYFEINKLFYNYLIEEDSYHIDDSAQLEAYNCQKKLLKLLEKFGKQETLKADDLVATLGKEYKEGTVGKNVIGIVDFYDNDKGFGFIESDDFDTRVFIHAEKIKEFEQDSLTDGDEILCDIERGPRGLFVSKIHEIKVDSNVTEVVTCQITRVFLDRGYGFVNSLDSGRSAFFHTSVFPKDLRSDIKEGDFLEAVIKPDSKSGGFQIKKIISYDENKV